MNWTKHGLIYSLDRSNDWRKSHAQMPIVDVEADGCWRIYYSSRNFQGCSLPVTIDVETGNPVKVVAENIKPLLELGAPGCFDEHGVMPTAIVRAEGKIYLYYIGWSCQQDTPYRNAIGLAVSSDNGKTFQKKSNNPIIAQSKVDPIYTGTFHICREDNKWHGYYMSCTEWIENDGQLDPCYLIKYASSTDGVKWHREGKVAIDFKHANEGGIVSATVVLKNNRFWMWYCYRHKQGFRTEVDKSYRIGLATSENAIDWIRQDGISGIDIDSEGWDSEMICYPNVVKYEGQLYMFYNGNGFGQSGIGYAVLPSSDLNLQEAWRDC